MSFHRALFLAVLLVGCLVSWLSCDCGSGRYCPEMRRSFSASQDLERGGNEPRPNQCWGSVLTCSRLNIGAALEAVYDIQHETKWVAASGPTQRLIATSATAPPDRRARRCPQERCAGINGHRSLFYLACRATGGRASAPQAVPKCDEGFRRLKSQNAVGTNHARISVWAMYSPVHG
jgi:hypothetical protein